MRGARAGCWVRDDTMTALITAAAAALMLLTWVVVSAAAGSDTFDVSAAQCTASTCSGTVVLLLLPTANSVGLEVVPTAGPPAVFRSSCWCSSC